MELIRTTSKDPDFISLVEKLDAYLTAPGQFLPGTAKSITGLPDAVERARIVAFLATLKD